MAAIPHLVWGKKRVNVMNRVLMWITQKSPRWITEGVMKLRKKKGSGLKQLMLLFSLYLPSISPASYFCFVYLFGHFTLHIPYNFMICYYGAKTRRNKNHTVRESPLLRLTAVLRSMCSTLDLSKSAVENQAEELNGRLVNVGEAAVFPWKKDVHQRVSRIIVWQVPSSACVGQNGDVCDAWKRTRPVTLCVGVLFMYFQH